MGATIDDCKVVEFEISTGENKAVADKIKSLLNNGYDVDMLYGNKTILLVGTKEASAASGSEESAGSGTTTETTETGGSEQNAETGGSDNTTPSEGGNESSGGGE